VSLGRIPTATRRRLEGAGTLWIDIESKERAALSNDVGEEIVQFLRRYGVRFFRDYGDLGGLHGGIEAPSQ
jgi:hypothetical protein